jgi:hypothetical protein
MKNILIYTINPFDFKCGGLVVQYQLCKIIDSLGINIRIHSPKKIENSIFSKYYNNEFDINNTIVIYGETIKGNPLNAPYVVRWMLAELGQNVSYNILDSWDKNELVYYFNSEEKIANNPDKLGNLYKILNVIYINPMAINKNLKSRAGTCFTIRKAINIHNKKPKVIHPPNSFEITTEHSQIECIKIFNQHKYFISYDSITFLSVIAVLCGCISIVKKVDGLSKQDWLNTTSVTEYLKESGQTLYGIAYGADDLQNAINTIHLAKEQWDKIVEYSKTKYVLPFINDINNWNNNINTIQSNFITTI